MERTEEQLFFDRFDIKDFLRTSCDCVSHIMAKKPVIDIQYTQDELHLIFTRPPKSYDGKGAEPEWLAIGVYKTLDKFDLPAMHFYVEYFSGLPGGNKTVVLSIVASRPDKMVASQKSFKLCVSDFVNSLKEIKMEDLVSTKRSYDPYS